MRTIIVLCTQNHFTWFSRAGEIPLFYVSHAHSTLYVSLYTMYLTVHYISHSTLCVSLYTMCLTVHYVSHCTLCVSLYTMYLTVHIVSHCTPCVYKSGANYSDDQRTMEEKNESL